MAQTATIYRFHLELADIDNGMYESLDLRVAQHPSEGEERLVVRVLARGIAHEPDLEFGRGLSNVEEPAICRQTPTGEIDLWIDVGIPSAERLHRASKRAKRVMVFTHKLEVALRKEWNTRTVHKAETLDIVRLDPALIRELVALLDRTVTWYLTMQDGTLSVSAGERNFSCPIERVSLADFLASPE